MVGMAACAGSGGSSTTPRPPTLDETVRAVSQAQTPAQGTFAYNQIQAFVGVSNSSDYTGISQDDRDFLAELFGSAIAAENISPSALDYSDAVAANNEEYGTAFDEMAVLDQLNDDLAAVDSDPSVPGRASLQLLLALEGGGATPTKHLTPAGSLLFAQWFALRMAPDESPLVRSACTQACLRTFQNRVRAINLSTRAELAALRTLLRRGLITPTEFARAVQALNNRRQTLLQQAQTQYQNCLTACHGQ